MNYEDDELERMRARREQRRNGEQRRSGEQRSKGGSRKSSDSGDVFKSHYNGPRNGLGGGTKEHRVSGNKRRSSQKKKRMMILAAEILILLVIVVGAAGWYVYQRTWGALQVIDFNEKKVENINLTSEQLSRMKGYMTVACFGVDSRSVGGKQSVGKGNNADVNMICSVNLETGEIKLVSVFRDTYLNISDKNSYNKINAAYANGGPEQAVKALNKNLGLNITQYATFNWKAVADAINILGGIDVEISQNEFSWINAYITETVNETGIGSDHLKKAGLVHLDGVQAVAYGRLRLGDTDYARTERQRIILQKAFDKAKNANWATLNNILQTVTPQLATNVTLTDLIPLARRIKDFHIADTAGFPSARGEMEVNGHGDCVVPQTLETNVTALHKFLFNVDDYQVPSNVKEYSRYISDQTGMYKEGTYIGHVPVDQGINASSYIKRKQQNANKKAVADKKEKSTEDTPDSSADSSTDSSTESGTADSTGESGTGESSTGDGWDDEWEDEEWETDEWIGGPGTTGPGSQIKPTTSSPNKNPGDKPSEEDAAATGPGMTPTTESPKRPGSGDKTNNSTNSTNSSQEAGGSGETASVAAPGTSSSQGANSAVVGPGASGPGA